VLTNAFMAARGTHFQLLYASQAADVINIYTVSQKWYPDILAVTWARII